MVTADTRHVTKTNLYYVINYVVIIL
uniref:Uncharacterized protein n=1 Tax=Rhizophora mucronata TaxID=61149 RepID=A0A2P2IJ08_RHIMU